MFNCTPKGDWDYARNKVVQIVTPMVKQIFINFVYIKEIIG